MENQSKPDPDDCRHDCRHEPPDTGPPRWVAPLARVVLYLVVDHGPDLLPLLLEWAGRGAG